MSTAALASRVALSALASVEAHGPIMGMDGPTMAAKIVREYGGRARTKRGVVQGWQFRDGSRVAPDFTEVLDSP